MGVYFWIVIGLAVVIQGKSVKKLRHDDIKLEWSNHFHVRGVRSSLTSGIIEEYEMWASSHMLSRIDYNNGKSKSMIFISKPKIKRGYKIDIHPETTKEEKTNIVCKGIFKDDDHKHGFKLETILPKTTSYKADGEEVVADKDCIKFTSLQTSATIWAAYENDTWIPVRHEVIEFNQWLGSKEKHEVWDFFDYTSTYSDEDVFDIKSYNCTKVHSELHSEDATKHLTFIDPENHEHVDHLFETFKNNYNKQYSSANEHAMRKSIFRNNIRLIKENNRRNTGFKFSINQFVDKTPQEIKKYKGLLKRPKGKVGSVPFPYNEHYINYIVNDLPKEYDARLYGLVSSVKNQDDCGSCWTFGTTAAAEGALARANGGRLLALSNQALIDCAWAFGASGCDGGYDASAYEWMMEYGLPTVAEYGPYMNRDDECRIKNMTKTYPIRGFTDVTPFSVGALKVALVNHGPLSVSVAVSDAFELYSSGIFYDPLCSQTDLDHAVTLVGYGERDGDTYWILKNSWGPNWGIGGYMHISARDNNCGVATEPTYVVY